MGTVPDLASSDDLLGSGLIGSMAVFRLVAFLEEQYGIRIPPEEMVIDNFITVDAMSTYVKERQSARV